LFLALAAAAGISPSPFMQTTVRIVAMGDSTTAGTPGFASPIEAPPGGRGNEQSQYAYWLMRAHPEWEVLNRGVDGERTDQIAARFERDVIGASPRIVVIIAGVNDIYQGRSARDVTRRLREMYDRAARAGIRVVAGTIIPFNTATRDQNDRMREVNAWIREQSGSDPALGFVDTRAAVAPPGNPDMLASSPDQLHPSPDGYRRMAEAIGPAIEAVLKR
jgi:lysophospholipase L1-like esterase